MVRLDVEAHGDGTPIVFLHGLTFDRRLLVEASEPIFERGLRARRLYVDLPGHGATPSDERAASAEGLVLAVAAWLDTVGSAPPIIVGHSYGAYLALGLAATRPVAALALVTPVVEPDLARRRASPRRVAVREELVFSADEAERAMFEEIAVVQSAAVLDRYRRLVKPASERTDRAFLEVVRARYVLPIPLVASLVAVPALFLCGRDDHWAGYEDTLPFVRALPDSELVVVPGCGQLLPIEAPGRYRAVLGDFIARHVAPA